MEMNLKLVRSKNADPMGEQEALVRENLLEILRKFGLQKLFQPEGAAVNEVHKLKLSEDENFEALKIKDKRLMKLWNSAKKFGFSGRY